MLFLHELVWKILFRLFRIIIFILFVVCAVYKMEASLEPYSLFSVLAFTYVGAMVASNSSLSWVSYPTQVSPMLGCWVC